MIIPDVMDGRYRIDADLVFQNVRMFLLQIFVKFQKVY